MSFLAPLYLFGALAIAAPILWHLIRKRPKNVVPFSSLLFLRQSPPRITRRSRLDNWPLLLLRALALLLLAIAFARPLFRSSANETNVTEGRRVVVMVDTSASMKRDTLWDAAKAKVLELVESLDAADSLAVITFDREPKMLSSFDETSRLVGSQRASQVKLALDAVEPSYCPSRLGEAIAFAGEYAQEVGGIASTSGDDDAEGNEPLPTQILLVSDMQSGSDVSSLASYAWPERCRLEVHSLVTKPVGNASLQLLDEASEEDQAGESVRVRVTNSPSATVSTFTVAWDKVTGAAALPIQVPPGQSRVVRLPRPMEAASAIVLQGDEMAFDNEWFVATPKVRQSKVIFVGSPPEDRRASLAYYLEQIPLGSRYHEITLEQRDAASLVAGIDPASTPLVIVGEVLNESQIAAVTRYVNEGGRLLWVIDDPASLDVQRESVRRLTGVETLELKEATVRDYAMLTRIDFSHELFTSMADPRFNDFSKIHVWSHRELSGVSENWKTVVAFEDGSPAFVEAKLGAGKLWLMTFGWQPKNSQLALSTKFIPLVLGMTRSRDSGREERTSFLAGDEIPSDWVEAVEAQQDALAWFGDDGRFAVPGVYARPEGDGMFAVNVSPSESDTDPISLESIERFGVEIGTTESREELATRMRQVQDRELERRQRLWQWAIVVVLGLVGVETLASGIVSRPSRDAVPSEPSSRNG